MRKSVAVFSTIDYFITIARSIEINMNKYLKDRLLLIMSSVILIAFGFAGAVLLHNTALPNEMDLFVMGSGVYIFIIFYMAYNSWIIRKNWKSLLVIFFLISSVVLPIVMLYHLYSHRVIDLPSGLIVYVAGGVGLSLLSISVLEKLLRKQKN